MTIPEAVLQQLQRLAPDEQQKVLEYARALQPRQATANGAVDCFSAAVALAQDLGPGFSSEDPHALDGRGEDWFGQR
jgi:hypothetical protein